MRALGKVVSLAVALSLLGLGCGRPQPKVQRFGSVIGVKPESLDEYKKLHAAVWPAVLRRLEESHIRNYSIYLAEVEKGRFYLLSYMEYTGDDLKGDMAKLAADPIIKEWWKHTDPLQSPVPTRKEGEWWASMEEVFHMD